MSATQCATCQSHLFACEYHCPHAAGSLRSLSDARAGSCGVNAPTYGNFRIAPESLTPALQRCRSAATARGWTCTASTTLASRWNPCPPRLRCDPLLRHAHRAALICCSGVVQNGQTATDGLYQGPTALSFGANWPLKHVLARGHGGRSSHRQRTTCVTMCGLTDGWHGAQTS